MAIANGLPYAPHRYDSKVHVVAISALNQFVLPSDTTRVYLGVRQVSGVVSATGAIGFGGNSASNAQFPYDGVSMREFNWYFQFNLLQSEIYLNNMIAASVFSVTEITYRQLTQVERNNATRKPESLADKIASFIRSKSGRGNISIAAATKGKPASFYMDMGRHASSGIG